MIWLYVHILFRETRFPGNKNEINQWASFILKTNVTYFLYFFPL